MSESEESLCFDQEKKSLKEHILECQYFWMCRMEFTLQVQKHMGKSVSQVWAKDQYLSAKSRSTTECTYIGAHHGAQMNIFAREDCIEVCKD